jgi:hypothetical protein
MNAANATTYINQKHPVMIKSLLIISPLLLAAILAIQYFFDGHPAINIQCLTKEFDNVPDSNAEYTFGVYSDLPIAGDASRIIDWLDGYPGHSFVRLTKISGNQCVTKTFGLYPQLPLLGLIYFGDLPGKISDDATHDFDISYSIRITEHQFGQLLTTIIAEGEKIKYNVQAFNCTDFAVRLLNSLRPEEPVVIYRDYLLNGAFLLSTPGGLFNALQKKKTNIHGN